MRNIAGAGQLQGVKWKCSRRKDVQHTTGCSGCADRRLGTLLGFPRGKFQRKKSAQTPRVVTAHFGRPLKPTPAANEVCAAVVEL